MFDRLNAWADFLLPDHVREAGRGRQARLLVLILLAACVVDALTVLLEVMSGVEGALHRTTYAFAAVLALDLGVLWAGARFEVVLHLTLAVVLGWVASVSVATGGIQSPALGHMMLVAAAAGAFLGRRATLLWLLLCVAAIPVVASLTPAHVPWFGRISLGSEPVMGVAVGVQGLVQLALMVWYMDRGRALEASALAQNVWALERTHDELEERRCALELAEAEARAARWAAEEAMASRTSFLATMSHEIRTPLNGTLGSLQMLLQHDLSEDNARLVQVARRSASTLLALVDDILALTRFENDDIPIEPSVTALSEVVADVHAVLDERARHLEVDFALELDPGLPELAWLDPGRVRQVLVNLAGNAIKFSPQGRVDVWLGSDGDGCMVVTVADNGIGMSPAVLARLFTPYMQADGSTTRRFGGTGLGLAITHKLVTAMQGRIEVSSVEGQGSTFSLWLPIRAATPAEVAVWQAARAPVQADAALEVVLAEDNPVNVLIATGLLKGLGCTVSVAQNGAEAVRLATERAPDLVLMDVQMPVMDGLEATRRLRALGQTGRRLTIVGLSADAMPGERDKALQAGMDSYLTKPVDRDELARCLAEVRASKDIRARLPEGVA